MRAYHSSNHLLTLLWIRKKNMHSYQITWTPTFKDLSYYKSIIPSINPLALFSRLSRPHCLLNRPQSISRSSSHWESSLVILNPCEVISVLDSAEFCWISDPLKLQLQGILPIKSASLLKNWNNSRKTYNQMLNWRTVPLRLLYCHLPGGNRAANASNDSTTCILVHLK